MEKAKISELKNRLSAYLKMVQAGQSVLVLDRNRPIARIEPLGRVAGRVEARTARLAAAGLVRVPRRALTLALFKSKPPRSRRSVLKALLDERAEGR
jgi:prevent-host-death family protein